MRVIVGPGAGSDDKSGVGTVSKVFNPDWPRDAGISYMQTRTAKTHDELMALGLLPRAAKVTSIQNDDGSWTHTFIWNQPAELDDLPDTDESWHVTDGSL